MSKAEAIKIATTEYAQFTYYVYGSQVIVRDTDSKLITKIPFVSESQPKLF